MRLKLNENFQKHRTGEQNEMLWFSSHSIHWMETNVTVKDRKSDWN